MPANIKAASKQRVIIGRVCGIYGVAGWLKVFSYTRPRENIFNFRSLMVGLQNQWEDVILLDAKKQGKGLILKFEGLTDRDAARQYIEKDIAVFRDALPDLKEGELYWCDLIGLSVINNTGQQLGTVSEIQETGANDVLVVEGKERQLIPMVFDKYIIDVDLEKSLIVVDWDSRCL